MYRIGRTTWPEIGSRSAKGASRVRLEARCIVEYPLGPGVCGTCVLFYLRRIVRGAPTSWGGAAVWVNFLAKAGDLLLL